MGWGKRESPGAYDYQGLEHRERETTLGKERMAAPHTQSHSSLEALLFLHLQVIKNNLNPTWKRFSVPLQHFCGGDPSTHIQVRSLPLELLNGGREAREGFILTWHLPPVLYIHTHLPPLLPIQVRCSDYDSDGSHDLIGSFHTSLAQLQAAPVSAGPAPGRRGGQSSFIQFWLMLSEFPTLIFLSSPG